MKRIGTLGHTEIASLKLKKSKIESLSEECTGMIKIQIHDEIRIRHPTARKQKTRVAMSSSVQKIGYPFMESKICETGRCHLQS